jgi:hypothetical protein
MGVVQAEVGEATFSCVVLGVSVLGWLVPLLLACGKAEHQGREWVVEELLIL